MADEVEVLDENINNENKVEKRIKDLSEKVKLTAHERDELQTLKTELEGKVTTTEKERDFYKDFSASSARYPQATEYQDQIKEKVMQGYTVDDAVVAVLAKENKLSNYTPPAPKQASPAGGSATNNISQGGEKSLKDMSREEKRAALQEIEDSEGGLSNILRRSM